MIDEQKIIVLIEKQTWTSDIRNNLMNLTMNLSLVRILLKMSDF